MIEYKKLDADLVTEYFDELCEFYYANASTCSCEFDFSLEKAQLKIEGMRDFLLIEKAVCYGAFDGEKIVGYFWSYIHQFRQEVRLYLNEIHIRSEYRSQGIGHEFIKLLEAEAQRLGLKAIYLHAEGSNEKGINFYLREGYKIERLQFRKEL